MLITKRQNVRLRRSLNQFHILYTLGRQVQVAMQRNMRGEPCKNTIKAMGPLTSRKIKGKKFYLHSYL